MDPVRTQLALKRIRDFAYEIVRPILFGPHHAAALALTADRSMKPAT